MKRIWYIMILGMLFFGCSEDELDRSLPDVDDDLKGPSLNAITHPAINEVFTLGENIDFNIMIFDKTGLKEFIQVILPADSSVLACNPNDCVAVISYKRSEIYGEYECQFKTSITVGAKKDNYPDPNNIRKDIEWKSGDYYVVSKGVDLKNNVNYSFKYAFKLKL